MKSDSKRGYPVEDTFSRTSVTIDESAAILLGWGRGPIAISSFNENPSDEELEDLRGLTFCLRDCLEGDHDSLESAYIEATLEGLPSEVIAGRHAAVKEHEEVIGKAQRYLCAIKDELNKGESSELRTDKDLSNDACIYITLSSLDAWARERFNHPILDSDGVSENLTEPQGGISRDRETDLQGGASKKAARTRMLDQERAILEEISKLEIDPKNLPKNPSGKAGVKSKVRESLNGKKDLFRSKRVFDKAWERLRSNKDIAEAASSP